MDTKVSRVTEELVILIEIEIRGASFKRNGIFGEFFPTNIVGLLLESFGDFKILSVLRESA